MDISQAAQQPKSALLIAVIITAKVCFVSSTCSDYSSSGCEVCVQQSSWFFGNCRWCVLDKQCHEQGSIAPFNACTMNGVIKSMRKCPKDDRNMYGIYDPHLSYKLLKLSAISYSNSLEAAKKCLDKLVPDSDIQIVEFIGRHCEDLPLFSYKMCLAVVFLSHQEKAIAVAYRGTASVAQLLKQITSMHFLPKVNSGVGGQVQEYFKKAHNKLYPCVSTTIHELLTKYPEYKVYITGHSLGGAVASITTAKLLFEHKIQKDKMALYTYGMPRVGDRDYATEHYSLVNNS